MRKVAVLLITLFLLATPALAAKKDAKGNDRDNSVEVEQNCNPAGPWKNHGEYVSCVAKLHPGGKEVSEAAKSEIGKKEDDEDKPEHSATPSASPSVNPSASPSASPSPVGIGDSNPAISAIITSGTQSEIKALIEILRNIIKSLQHLIGH